MAAESATNRRRFLQGAGSAGALIALGAVSACGRESGKAQKGGADSDGAEAGSATAAGDPCSDLTGLTPEQAEFRGDAGYVDESSTPEERCDNCNFWKPPRDGAPCGACTAVAGPIHASGYCDLWEEKKS